MLSVQNKLPVQYRLFPQCTDNLFCAENNKDEGQVLLLSERYSYHYVGLIRRVCCVLYNQ
jgi:hypothetical protein